MSNNRIVTTELPEADILAAFGELNLRHGQLEHELKFTIQSLTGVGILEALRATERCGPKELRERILKLAKKRFGDGRVFIKLSSNLGISRRFTDKRNAYVHTVVGRILDGEYVMKNAEHIFEPLPKVSEIKDLAAKIEEITLQLRKERMGGEFAEALVSTSNV